MSPSVQNRISQQARDTHASAFIIVVVSVFIVISLLYSRVVLHMFNCENVLIHVHVLGVQGIIGLSLRKSWWLQEPCINNNIIIHLLIVS